MSGEELIDWLAARGQKFKLTDMEAADPEAADPAEPRRGCAVRAVGLQAEGLCPLCAAVALLKGSVLFNYQFGLAGKELGMSVSEALRVVVTADLDEHSPDYDPKLRRLMLERLCGLSLTEEKAP